MRYCRAPCSRRAMPLALLGRSALRSGARSCAVWEGAPPASTANSFRRAHPRSARASYRRATSWRCSLGACVVVPASAHSGRLLAVITRCQRGSYRPDLSDQPDVDGLRSLAALDHVDRYSLALRQIGEAAAVERRGVNENILTAAVPNDEPEPLIP